jgi:predicted transposase YbfD/YdcC
METTTITIKPLADYFQEIEDPRIDRKKLYPLLEIIVTSILAFLSGAEGWEDIDDFAKCRKEWLGKHLALKNGLPGHDVYRRVFIRLDPEQLQKCFMEWVKAARLPISEDIIAIDGKSMRGSVDTIKCLKMAHIVSAYSSDGRLTLAQVKTDEKSNEITAIPELLALIVLKGAIVTIDAMGCQYKIADQIIKAGGNWLFSLKGNQETLHNDVKEYLENVDFEKPEKGVNVAITYENDHGRAEKRSHAITDDVEWIKRRRPHWKSLRSIGVIESRRYIKSTGKETVERRYYITSLPPDAKLFAHAARAHWGIENGLHHILDVVFKEDNCKIRSGYGPQNLNTIRKIALILAESDKGSKKSIRKRVKMMGWSQDYLEKLLINFQSRTKTPIEKASA